MEYTYQVEGGNNYAYYNVAVKSANRAGARRIYRIATRGVCRPELYSINDGTSLFWTIVVENEN